MGVKWRQILVVAMCLTVFGLAGGGQSWPAAGATPRHAADVAPPLVGPLQRLSLGRGEDDFVDAALVPGGGYEVMGVSPQRTSATATFGSPAGEERPLTLVRFRADGSLDPSFGTGGVALNMPSTFCGDWAGAMTVLSDGSTIAAGPGYRGIGCASTQPSDLWVGRFDSHGRPDPAMGTDGDGIAKLSIPGGLLVDRVAARPNGGFVVMGRAGSNGSAARIAAFLPSGSIDTSFGVGGVQSVQLPQDTGPPRWSATAPDGSWYVVGAPTAVTSSTVPITIAKVKANGALDAAFGTGGVAAIPFGNNPFALTYLAVTADGQSRPVITDYDRLIRLTTVGALDSTFGTGGYVYAGQLGFWTVEADGDALVTVGRVSDPRSLGTPDYVDAGQRLNPDGSVDTSAGRGGFFPTPFATGTVDPPHLLLDHSAGGTRAAPVWVAAMTGPASPFVVGNGYPYGDADFAVARELPTGQIDPAFNGGMLRTLNVGATGDNTAKSSAASSDGGAYVGVSAAGHLGLLRFTSAGQPNGAFGGSGTVNSFDDAPPAAVVGTGDGGAVVLTARRPAMAVGQSTNAVQSLVKYRTDGTADPAFGGTGHVDFPIDPNADSYELPLDPIVLANGDIVVITPLTTKQYSATHQVTAYVVDRRRLTALRPDGTPDTLFGVSGIVEAPLNISVIATNGYRIYVGGATPGSGNQETQIMALDDHGRVDPTFAGGGIATLGNLGEPQSVFVAADGSAVVSSAFRIDADGQPDPSYHPAAPLAATQVDVTGRMYGLSITSDSHWALQRLDVEGGVDPTWANGGSPLPLDLPSGEPAQVTLLRGGSLLVTGSLTVEGGNEYSPLDLATYLVSPGDIPPPAAPSATTTTVYAAPTNPAFGAPTTLDATVVAPGGGSPSGLVQFTDAGAELGSAAVDSSGHASATVTLPTAGPATITATYRPLGTAFVQSQGTVTVTVQPPPCDANCKVLRAVYTDFLGRQPTDSELRFLDALLNGSAATRQQIVDNAARSPEWLGHVVDQLYLNTLGRPADGAGKSYWIGRLASGQISVAQAAAGFYSSDEYFRGAGGGTVPTWVSDLYQKLLHRGPDAAGLSYWTARTASTSRGTVAYELYQSLESRNDRTAALYQALLGRPPDLNGLAYWSGRLTTDGDVALAAYLAGSDEYFTRAQSRF